MLLAVPNGRMASGIGRPANATAALLTVPSPPAVTARSMESSMVRANAVGIVDQMHDVVAKTAGSGRRRSSVERPSPASSLYINETRISSSMRLFKFRTAPHR